MELKREDLKLMKNRQEGIIQMLRTPALLLVKDL